MRKAASLAAVFLGLLLMLGSCVPGGLTVYRAFVGEPQLSVDMAVDGTHRTATASLEPGSEAQVAFALRIETTSVQQLGRASEAKYQARYSIPFGYRVRDSGGGALADQDGTIDWESSVFKVTRNEIATSTGAALSVEHRLARFVVPEDGAVFIEAWLEPDTRYLARAGDAKLLVYDAQASAKGPWVAWLAMLAGGFVLAIAGGIAFISSMAAAAAAGAPAAAGTAAGEDAPRYRAVICHLAGFCGYVVPLGHLIAPVVAWLVWRNGDAFANEHGREAINFQLSITLYMAVSALLVILLVGFLLLLVLAVMHIVMMAIAAASAGAGKPFRYPMTIRFLR